ncbi:rab11 family-interacting protein 3 isoform X2 [Hyperolius riggenbachi]|uniref:rab11 family-interacting protein 3 isoform X2 n=1 Tax=Hyperolius riggenbachi TaxID=752182 RepID=UPI0035A3ADE7
MRMDGDPHLTAWGSLDAEPIGGQRAIDLISPQQVVGSYFLMGAEEKACISLQTRLEIPDEQGGLMPMLSLYEETLLQPPGAIEDQSEADHCESLHWDGEEEDTVAGSTLDLSKDSSLKPSSYCTLEMPPLISVPSEITHSAVYPPLVSKDPDHHHHLMCANNSPHADHTASYLFDVHQLIVPELVLSPKTDYLPHCSLASVTDKCQNLMPSNGFLDLEETQPFTCRAHLKRDAEPVSCDELASETDRISPTHSCLPLTADNSFLSEPLEESGTKMLNQFISHLGSGTAELSQSESNIYFGTVGLSQADSGFDSRAVEMPQSKPFFENGIDELSHCAPCLTFTCDQLPQSESHSESDFVPQCEASMNLDIDDLPEAETCLNLTVGDLPESDFCVRPYINDLSEAETFMNSGVGYLPEAEAFMGLAANEFPESDNCLNPGLDELPEAECFVIPDCSELPESETFLNHEDGDLHDDEVSLNSNIELSEADREPLSESSLQPDSDQLPQSDLCSDSGTQLPQAETYLHFVSNNSARFELQMESNSCSLPLPNPCIDSDSDRSPYSELCRGHGLDEMSQSDSCLDCNVNSVRQSEPYLDPESYFSSDLDQIPHTETCLQPDINCLNQSKSYVGEDNSNSISCLSPESNQSPQPETSLDPCTNMLHQSSSYLDPDTAHLPPSEVCLHSSTSHVLLSDSDHFGSTSDTDHLLHTSSKGSHAPQTEDYCSSNFELLPPTETDYDLEHDHLLQCQSNSHHHKENVRHTTCSSDSNTDSLLLSELCMGPSFNYLTQSESDSVCQSPQAGTGLKCEGELLSKSNSDIDSDDEHSVQSDTCTQFNEYETCLNLKRLSGCGIGLDPKADQCASPDLCFELPTDHPPQPDCHLTNEFAQVFQGEPCFEKEMLSCSPSYLEQDCNVLSKSEVSVVPSLCHMPHSETCSTSVIDHAPQFELYLNSDAEPLPLSETFLAHENDQLICSESVSDLDSGRMTNSESSLASDDDTKFSSLFDSSADFYPDRLLQHKVTLNHNSEQLLISDSYSYDSTDLVSLCDAFMARETDQLSFSEFSDPDHLPLNKPMLACNTDHLQVCESLLRSDGLKPCMASKTDYLLKVPESCFESESGQLTKLESCLKEDSDGASVSEASESDDTHHVPLSHCPLPVNTDELPLSESFVFPETTHQLPLSDSPVDSQTSQLPKAEPCMDLNDKHQLPKLESNLQRHLPSSDQLSSADNAFISCDDEFMHLTECFLARKQDLPELGLTPNIDHFPLGALSEHVDSEMSLFDELLISNANESFLPEAMVTPTSEELSLSESSFPQDTNQLTCISAPVNDQLCTHDPLSQYLQVDGAPLCESPVSPNSDHPSPESLVESSPCPQPQSVSCLSSETDHSESESENQPLPDSDSDCFDGTQANTSFSNSIIEEFQIPWDWTPDVKHTELPEVGLDCGTDMYLNLSAGDLTSQVHDTEDCFQLFCLDTPPESPETPAETDPLALSDDLLSLCDVFSQLQSNDLTLPEDDSGGLCHALDHLSLHQMDSEINADQEPLTEGKILPQLHQSQLADFSSMSTSDHQVDLEVSDDKPISSSTSFDTNPHFINTLPSQMQGVNCDLDFSIHDPEIGHLDSYCLDLLFKSDWSSCETDSDSYCLDLLFKSDLSSCKTDSDSYCLDLLFKSDLSSCETELDSYCLDVLFKSDRTSCETESLPNSFIADLCPQSLSDPSPGSTIFSTVAGNVSCDIIQPSELHAYNTESTLLLEKSLPTTLSDDDHLPPSSWADSSLGPSHFPQGRSDATKTGSTSELVCEPVQIPLVVLTQPLELFDYLTEAIQNVFANSQEGLPPDNQFEMDTMEDDEGMLLNELNASASQCSYASSGATDPTGDLPSNDVTQPQPDISFEPPTFPVSGSVENIMLSSEDTTLENTQVLPCDSHQPADSRDLASAPFSFGEGDPFLAFALDNDSPCAGDELARLRAVFDALDRDKDGFVKMEDFVQFATVYGAEQVKYLTGYLDPAGLGVINFRDFYRGISEIQNEDLDMQLYDMGYPSEGEPACSVDFDDLAAFEVTEVTDSAYVGSESAYSECETFTDEDSGGLAAQEDQETEGDGTGHRAHSSATPESLELSLCDISVITVAGQEEQFEDFGEGAEPDLFSSHCEDEPDSFIQTSSSTQLLTPSPDKRTSSRKEARRLHHNGFLGEESAEQPVTDMAYDETDLIEKVVYLEQKVSELERDASTTGDQQNRLRQENLHLLHRAHALEEQLKEQEERTDEVQSEETRKHREELRKMERDRSYHLTSLNARIQELESENLELRSQLPNIKATIQRLEEENHKLRDQVEDLQQQLIDHQEQNKKLGGKLCKERHNQQKEKERCQEVIEELRRELEQTQLLRLEMEQRMGLGNSAALQEYNSRTREAELEHEVRRLKQEQRILKEQNEELNGQIINLSIQGAKNLFSTTFSDSLAAEISSVSRDELMEAIQKQEEINLRLQDYIDRIIVAIMETNPAILEVKMH